MLAPIIIERAVLLGLPWVTKAFAKQALLTKVIYNFISFLLSFSTLFVSHLLKASGKISDLKRTRAGQKVSHFLDLVSSFIKCKNKKKKPLVLCLLKSLFLDLQL